MHVIKNIGSVTLIGIFYCLFIGYLFIGKKPYRCTSIDDAYRIINSIGPSALMSKIDLKMPSA